MKISPFAPDTLPVPLPLAGFDMAVAETGLQYKGRPDLWVLRASEATEVAGVFTQNQIIGAPVTWTRTALYVPQRVGSCRLLVVNAGNANVFTGEAGRQACAHTAQAAARHFGGHPEMVLLASTGVIGEQLDAEKLTVGFASMADTMRQDGWVQAAQAIMTTDTFPKIACIRTHIGQTPITLNAIAKGSGMIAPNMATMLAFIATDACLPQNLLQAMLHSANQTSFNAITVDGDCSTSDMLLLLASGSAEHAPVTDVEDSALEGFKKALQDVMNNLANQIIQDAEGISKFITIRVSGATSTEAARLVGFAIAHSPLVKTAIAGEDANWGRIVMAVGKAPVPVVPERLGVWLGPHSVAEQGARAVGYNEALLSQYMRRSEIEIHVNLGLGAASAMIRTSDLTHDYININADYRT